MGLLRLKLKYLKTSAIRVNCYRENSRAARVTLTAYQYNKDFRILGYDEFSS